MILHMTDRGEAQAMLRRRGLQALSRTPRALAARWTASPGRDDSTRLGTGLLGVAIGTAAILTVKVSMLWTALHAL